MLPPVDFPTAARPKDTGLWSTEMSAQWIAVRPQTITSNHRDLQKILVPASYKFHANGTGANTKRPVEETIYGQWPNIHCPPARP